ncbi:uncharacterized protein LOC144475638 [Augochlora pura]
MKRMIGLMGFVVTVLGYTVINEQCKTDEKFGVSCRCADSKRFEIPGKFRDYQNMTSLHIEYCRSAHLSDKNLILASQLAEITVDNIEGTLMFELIPKSKNFKDLKLSHIQSIPSLTREIFSYTKQMNMIMMEDVRIGHLGDLFSNTSIAYVILTNVTVEYADKLHFSEEKGNLLRIVDSEFRNIADSCYFSKFLKVEIVRSKFHLKNPGKLIVEADDVLVENCVFSNTSISITASDSVTMRSTCASGKSSMSIHSKKIVSTYNRLPNQINYHNKAELEPEIQNNTICKAGTCKCSKSSGQDTFSTTIASSYVYLFLISISILISARLESF